jgi:hypothetical protein
LNSASYLELGNTDTSTFNGGTQLRFGIVPGSPFAMLSSGVRSGPSPYEGQLVFAIKPTAAGALRNVLWLTQTGSLQSTDDPNNGRDFGPRSSFGAYNQYGAQAFAGYSETALGIGNTTAGGYFVAKNNIAVVGASNGWGVYSDCQGHNTGFCWEIEVDVGNQSGVAPATPDPNNLFGLGAGPLGYSIVSQPVGIGNPVTARDVSGWTAVAGINGIKFQKGLIFFKDAIATIGGHMEAINLAAGQELAWYNSAGTNIGRFKSDGTTPFWNGNAFAISASSPIVLSASTGALTCPTCLTSTGLGTNVGTWLATPSSANLRSALTDETGGGAAVFASTPTIDAPIFTGNIVPTYTGSASMLAKTTDANSAESWTVGINARPIQFPALGRTLPSIRRLGPAAVTATSHSAQINTGVSGGVRMTLDKVGNLGAVGTVTAPTLTVGSGNPGYKAWFNAATDENFAVGSHLSLADGIQLISVNNANNAYKGMQFSASIYLFNTSNGSMLPISATGGITTPGLPTSAGAGGLYVCIDTSGVMYKKHLVHNVERSKSDNDYLKARITKLEAGAKK